MRSFFIARCDKKALAKGLWQSRFDMEYTNWFLSKLFHITSKKYIYHIHSHSVCKRKMKKVFDNKNGKKLIVTNFVEKKI